MSAVYSWSCAQLSQPAARMFRLLGLHPGPDVSLPAAASMAGLTVRAARSGLDELVLSSLLTEDRPGRYWFHDLLRVYAAEEALAREDAADRHRALPAAGPLPDQRAPCGNAPRSAPGAVDLPAARPDVVPEHMAAHDEA